MSARDPLRLLARRLVDAAVARLERVGDDESGIDRRRFLVASGSSLAAALLTACNSQGPESAQRVLRYAERRNEPLERWLLRHTSIDHARAGAATAGSMLPAYYVSPALPVWDDATRGPWSLEVTGLVARPMRFSLEELVRLPQRRQRVNHYCVEGWNAVDDWWGVQMRELARVVGAHPEAQYVDFQSFDSDYHESWDLESATHPQTIIAYAKEGRLLPAAYGAPARLHSPVKLGYKSTKYLTRVVFMRERNGGYWSDRGYEWYAGT